MPTIYQIIIVALAAAFIVLVAIKTQTRYKVRDLCDVHGLKLIAQMLDCDFCFGFWSGVAVAIVLSIITLDLTWITVPIFSSPLTRYLI